MRKPLSFYAEPYKHTAAVLLCLCFMAVFSQAVENTERIFSRERSLVAVAHCSNLQLADQKLNNLLNAINPKNPFNKPLLHLLGPAVFNDALQKVSTEHWAEAVLLSLPLDKENDWVYVLRVSSQKEYIKSILGFGNIRQELQEEGITRYRQTFENSYNVFYISFTADNLLLLSRSRTALDITRKLYAFSSREGLLGPLKEDAALIFHLNRYFAGEPRLLPVFTSELNRDILRELAGSQAKKDNPLNLGVIQALKSLNRLLQEIAVIELSMDLQAQNVNLNLRLLPSYGGNVHYALSNLPDGETSLAEFLPPQATEVCEGKMWKEASEQIITGISAMVGAMLGREVSAQVQGGAEQALELFNKSSPSEYAMGMVVPENAGKRCGPLWVGLVRWKDPLALGVAWKNWLDFFTVGELAEMLAEKGMRLEISRESLRLPENPDNSSQVRIKLSSLYFQLPGVWGKDQRLMLSLQGNVLVVVAAAAPLDAAQYAEAQIFMQQVLRQTVTAVAAARRTESKPVVALQRVTTPQSILSGSMHPLRYLQQAFLAESIWPQENTPNRLPVPWGDYYREYKSFPLQSSDVLVSVKSVNESIDFKFEIPLGALVETVRACLDIKISGNESAEIKAGANP